MESTPERGWLDPGAVEVADGDGFEAVDVGEGGSDNSSSPEDATPQYKKPKPGLSGKEGAKDVPEWARGQRPLVTEDGKKFAQRLLHLKYGKGGWSDRASRRSSTN
jgi:hypothetical protein